MNRVIPDVNTEKYIVKKNDTLTSIAKQKMGTSDYFSLYEQNYEVIGNNPNDLKVGMELTIPKVVNNEAYID